MTKFMIFMILVPLGKFIIISSPQEKWYPECFNRAETLHAPRLKIRSHLNSKLSGNEFTDFEKFLKNMVEIPLKSAGCRGGFCPGGVLLTEVEASPLQVI